MEIDARAADAVAFSRGGDAADVAHVVVGEEEGDGIGEFEAGIVVLLDFGEDAQSWGTSLRSFLLGRGQDVLLVGDDFFQEFSLASGPPASGMATSPSPRMPMV